jgi:hypothetical protein
VISDEIRERFIRNAVEAAYKAFADLPLGDKIEALERLEYRIQVELAAWEQAQDPRVH